MIAWLVTSSAILRTSSHTTREALLSFGACNTSEYTMLVMAPNSTISMSEMWPAHTLYMNLMIVYEIIVSRRPPMSRISSITCASMCTATRAEIYRRDCRLVGLCRRRLSHTMLCLKVYYKITGCPPV